MYGASAYWLYSNFSGTNVSRWNKVRGCSHDDGQFDGCAPLENSSRAILYTGTLASIFSKPLDTPDPSPLANASCPFAVLEYVQWCRYQNSATAANISHF
jgi:hypothetical protein